MKTIRMVPLAIVLIFAVSACHPTAKQSARLSEEDVSAIRNLMDSYEQAVLAGDDEAAAAHWAEDVVRMPPNAPMIVGRAAMVDEFRARTFTVTQFEQALEEIDGRDGLAYARGPYSITVSMPEVPEPISDTGKSLAILRRQKNGSWVITIACWNSDLPSLHEAQEASESK